MLLAAAMITDLSKFPLSGFMDNFEYAHLHRDEIVWMSQNTNQLGPRKLFDAAAKRAVESRAYELYPPALGVPELRSEVLKDIGSEGKAVITNGGIEATYFTTRALLSPGDRVISCDPSFMPIHNQVTLCGAECFEIPVYDAGGKLIPEQVNEAINPKTKMLLLIDPLNPLGTAYTKSEVRAFAELCADRGLYLMHDVTYRHFAYEHVSAEQFYPERTITIYSFSKSCGMAGMRIGALVAPEPIVAQALKYNTNVLGVSVISQMTALELLKTKKEWMPGMVAQARKNQEIIKKAVDKCDDLSMPFYPSNANIFPIEISKTGLDPDAIEAFLLKEHNIFIRSGKYVSKRFGPRFIRISFTVPEAGCKKFAKVLPEALKKMKAKK
jgi:aspartate/methionine/tyrosine aminotransferase